MAKLHLITYGCQMNEYDSERVAGLLREHRYELTDNETEADLILVNTCAIREKAEDKVFSKLGQLRELKHRNPALVVGVMGCMAQLHDRAIPSRAPVVDLVFGSPAIGRVGELVDRARREHGRVVETGEGPLVKITSRPPAASRLKAYVTVMEGCEKHCTFCVVPTTRGRERSHPPETIVAEVRGLVAAGVKEITLLGQTVNAYGRDLVPRTDLGELFWRLDEIAGLERIRFTTSNPYNLTPDLVRGLPFHPSSRSVCHDSCGLSNKFRGPRAGLSVRGRRPSRGSEEEGRREERDGDRSGHRRSVAHQI
jgi:tRNA-2-methylthio-N6-dimethylallyladenosine synthase